MLAAQTTVEKYLKIVTLNNTVFFRVIFYGEILWLSDHFSLLFFYC